MNAPLPAPGTIDIHKDFSYLVAHEQAVKTIAAARDHVNAIIATWGPEHLYSTKACMSLMRQTTMLFTNFFGGTQRITKDGPLNLFVSTSSGLVYGLIFHARWHDAVMLADDDYQGTVPGTYRCMYCQTCKEPVRHSDMGPEPHRGHYTLPVPMPGDWSFHS